MRIVHVSSECVPYAKTGGLGDVVPALSKALAKSGNEVYIFLPRYGIINLEKLTLIKNDIMIDFNKQNTYFNVYKDETIEGVKVFFIDYAPLYDRKGVYGEGGMDFKDNGVRYLFLARAVIESCLALNIIPDVFHCHDWQASFVPIYLRTLYSSNELMKGVPVLLTIHNLSFQGLFPPEEIWGYTYLDYNSFFHMEGLEFYGKVNFLKGGIIYSDIITTVSPTYSKEIQEEEQGCGLEGLLRKRRDYIYGVLNGVDYEIWNPETDPFIPYHYSEEDLSGKMRCKEELMRECNFKENKEIPIIGMITRLTPQKGLDLVIQGLAALKEIPFRLVVLGTGLAEYEKALEEWSKREPQRVNARIEFNEALAHLIEAGADIFLMPSRYEPCGLNQMYSLRYGTVPIVRNTGGLADSIIDFISNPKNATGFKFNDYSYLTLLSTIDLAQSTFMLKNIWHNMMIRGMKQDFSWGKAAQTYIDLYKKAISMIRS